MSGQRHPYADHPAAAVLADHIAAIGVRAPTSRAACECGWRGAVCDYPAHLTEVLDHAWLLAEAVCSHGMPLTAPHCQGCDDTRDGTAPETPTTRVLAERADRRTT